MFGEIGLESLRKFASREHDTPSTAFAFEPDVRTEARDGPFKGAAWMLFPESQVVVQLKVWEHFNCQCSAVSNQ